MDGFCLEVTTYRAVAGKVHDSTYGSESLPETIEFDGIVKSLLIDLTVHKSYLHVFPKACTDTWYPLRDSAVSTARIWCQLFAARPHTQAVGPTISNSESLPSFLQPRSS